MSPIKKKNKAKKTKNSNKLISDEMLFELDGNVYVVEKKNGKEISREILDGETVLKSLIYILELSLSSLSQRK